jgi:Zn-dependent protease
VFDAEQLVLDAILIAIFLLVAFPVHEFAHALVAYRLGDGTAKLFGRLSLNPIVHFDPFGGLMIVLTALAPGGILLGWAKPTPVNPSNLRDRRNGEVIVSLAGPASNLLMAVAAGILFRVIDSTGTTLPQQVFQLLFLFVAYNVALTIFNLIPIPPLDGSALLFRFVSPATAWRLRPMLAQYGIFVLLALVLVGGQLLGRFMLDATRFLVGI